MDGIKDGIVDFRVEVKGMIGDILLGIRNI